MTGHRIADRYPVPSGWRAHCTCGWEGRGHDEADATTVFLEHAQAEHGTVEQETGE